MDTTAYHQTPPAPTAGAFDAALAAALGWRHPGSAANWRRRHGLAAKVEPDTRCRWCRSEMEREYALRTCSRLCRGCSAEAGREWMPAAAK